jgi:hypothetical protein
MLLLLLFFPMRTLLAKWWSSFRPWEAVAKFKVPEVIYRGESWRICRDQSQGKQQVERANRLFLSMVNVLEGE